MCIVSVRTSSVRITGSKERRCFAKKRFQNQSINRNIRHGFDLRPGGHWPIIRRFRFPLILFRFPLKLLEASSYDLKTRMCGNYWPTAPMRRASSAARSAGLRGRAHGSPRRRPAGARPRQQPAGAARQPHRRLDARRRRSRSGPHRPLALSAESTRLNHSQ